MLQAFRRCAPPGELDVVEGLFAGTLLERITTEVVGAAVLAAGLADLFLDVKRPFPHPHMPLPSDEKPQTCHAEHSRGLGHNCKYTREHRICQ